MKLLICLVIVFLPSIVFSQVKPVDTPSGVFATWSNIFQANKELNFLGVGPWKVNGQGAIPPVFEAQIRQPFLLLKGRDNQRPWKRALMVHFQLGLDLRMYQGPGNESNPVRPINFIAPGFTVDYFLNHFFRARNNIALEDTSKIKNFFNLQLYVSHYSNGQSGPFYTRDFTSTNKINGNFMTNFIRPQISWSRYTKNASLATVAVDWTHDFGIPYFLEIEEGLKGSYGFNRINLILQWRTQNKQLGYYWYKQAYYKKDPGDTTKIITQVRKKGRFKRYGSFLLRAQAGWILDNVDNFPTFNNRSSEKLRGSIKLTFGYYPANMRTLGLFALAYFGRDYYNIRYTDKLFNIKAGLLFDINKFVPTNTMYVSRNVLN